MTIYMSKDVESAIDAAVRSGRFTSADNMVAQLVRDDARRHPGQPEARPVEGDAGPNLGSIGAMRDAADELDEAMAHAIKLRQQPWRVPAGE